MTESPSPTNNWFELGCAQFLKILKKTKGGNMENEPMQVSKDIMKEIFGITEEVRAIQTLEYHNKNRLSGSNESRSRKQIDLLTEVLAMLSDVMIFNKT